MKYRRMRQKIVKLCVQEGLSCILGMFLKKHVKKYLLINRGSEHLIDIGMYTRIMNDFFFLRTQAMLGRVTLPKHGVVYE